MNGVGGNPAYTCNRDQRFTLTGMLRDLPNPVGSPLCVTRATYTRDDGATRGRRHGPRLPEPGQGAPALSAGGQNLPPVRMDGPTGLGDWYAQGIPVPPGVVPSNITVTNSGDVPPTTITTHVVDEVTVKSATYDRHEDHHRGRHLQRQGRRLPGHRSGHPLALRLPGRHPAPDRRPRPR